MHYDKIENIINRRNIEPIELVYEFENEILVEYFCSNNDLQQWIEAHQEYDILEILN